LCKDKEEEKEKHSEFGAKSVGYTYSKTRNREVRYTRLPKGPFDSSMVFSGIYRQTSDLFSWHGPVTSECIDVADLT